MPPRVEGKAAPKALGLCRTQCWRGGGGELPVGQEKPGHCGLLPSHRPISARGNVACCALLTTARSTEFSRWPGEAGAEMVHPPRPVLPLSVHVSYLSQNIHSSLKFSLPVTYEKGVLFFKKRCVNFKVFGGPK